MYKSTSDFAVERDRQEGFMEGRPTIGKHDPTDSWADHDPRFTQYPSPQRDLAGHDPDRMPRRPHLLYPLPHHANHSFSHRLSYPQHPYQAPHYVDYLAHDFAISDLIASWHALSKASRKANIRQRYAHPSVTDEPLKIFSDELSASGYKGREARLENACWRAWTQKMSHLSKVHPEDLNWLKDHDTTWLYGPLYTAEPTPNTVYTEPSTPTCPTLSMIPITPNDDANSHYSPEFADALQKGQRGIRLKSVLKKRSLSDILRGYSTSMTALSRLITSPLSPQQDDVPFYSHEQQEIDDTPSLTTTAATSPTANSEYLGFMPRPKLRFSERVEQCMALENESHSSFDSMEVETSAQSPWKIDKTDLAYRSGTPRKHRHNILDITEFDDDDDGDCALVMTIQHQVEPEDVGASPASPNGREGEHMDGEARRFRSPTSIVKLAPTWLKDEPTQSRSSFIGREYPYAHGQEWPNHGRRRSRDADIPPSLQPASVRQVASTLSRYFFGYGGPRASESETGQGSTEGSSQRGRPWWKRTLLAVRDRLVPEEDTLFTDAKGDDSDDSVSFYKGRPRPSLDTLDDLLASQTFSLSSGRFGRLHRSADCSASSISSDSFLDPRLAASPPVSLDWDDDDYPDLGNTALDVQLGLNGNASISSLDVSIASDEGTRGAFLDEVKGLSSWLGGLLG